MCIFTMGRGKEDRPKKKPLQGAGAQGRCYWLVMDFGFRCLFCLAETPEDVNHIAHRCAEY